MDLADVDVDISHVEAHICSILNAAWGLTQPTGIRFARTQYGGFLRPASCEARLRSLAYQMVNTRPHRPYRVVPHAQDCRLHVTLKRQHDHLPKPAETWVQCTLVVDYYAPDLKTPQ